MVNYEFNKTSPFKYMETQGQNYNACNAFCIIGTMLFCGISINTTASAVQKTALHNIDAAVKVSFNQDMSTKIMGSTGEYAHIFVRLPGKVLKQLDSLKHVTAYKHVGLGSCYAVNFKTIFDYVDKVGRLLKLLIKTKKYC